MTGFLKALRRSLLNRRGKLFWKPGAPQSSELTTQVLSSVPVAVGGDIGLSAEGGKLCAITAGVGTAAVPGKFQSEIGTTVSQANSYGSTTVTAGSDKYYHSLNLPEYFDGSEYCGCGRHYDDI